MKVFILQEFDGDDVPNARVFSSPKEAARQFADLVEYGALTDEKGEYLDHEGYDDWAGEEVDGYDNEGAVVVRLYSEEVI